MTAPRSTQVSWATRRVGAGTVEGRLRLIAVIAFVAIMVLRLGGVLVLHALSVARGNDGFRAIQTGAQDDGELYYRLALDINAGRWPGYEPYAFARFLAWLMRQGLTDVIELKLVNLVPVAVMVVLAGALAARVVHDVAAGHPDHDHLALRARILAMLGAGLYPSSLFWNSFSLMRDAWIFAAYLGIILVVQRCWRRADGTRLGVVGTLSAMGFGLVLVTALGSLRWYAALSVVVGFAVWRLLVSRRVAGLAVSPWARPWRMLIIGLAASYVGAVVLRAPLRAVTGVDLLAYRDQLSLVGGSSLGVQLSTAGPFEGAWRYAYSVVSNAIGPLPGQFEGGLQALPLVTETPVLIAITVLCFRFVRRTVSPTAQLLLTQALVWLLLLGLWNDNIGGATRLRIVGYMAIVPLAAAAWACRRHSTDELTASEIDRTYPHDEDDGVGDRDDESTDDRVETTHHHNEDDHNEHDHNEHDRADLVPASATSRHRLEEQRHA
jgi:hypothetical protein